MSATAFPFVHTCNFILDFLIWFIFLLYSQLFTSQFECLLRCLSFSVINILFSICKNATHQKICNGIQILLLLYCIFNHLTCSHKASSFQTFPEKLMHIIPFQRCRTFLNFHKNLSPEYPMTNARSLHDTNIHNQSRTRTWKSFI